MIRCARLDSAAYEQVEHDENATAPAAVIVVLAAIASGIGVAQGGLDSVLFAIVTGLIGWIAYSAIVYFVGTRLFATEATSTSVEELLRTLGFAQAPRLLLVLGFIPVLGVLIALAVFVWIILTTVVAIRQALDFSTGRAIATALVAVIVLVVIQALVLILFGA
ncbi:MAG: hypothetical protein GEU28_03055 [Dehalococcoidia bacterium]|nr:hypothetical protein [Dehalococcoidia bacterium]